MIKVLVLALALIFPVGNAWATAGYNCTCGPNSGAECTVGGSATECSVSGVGTAFANCCQAQSWETSDGDSAKRSFVQTKTGADNALVCGASTASVNPCVAPGDVVAPIWDTGNACAVAGAGVAGDVGSCTASGQACTYCNADGDCPSGTCVVAQNTCTSECMHCADDEAAVCDAVGLDSQCDRGGEMVIVDQTLQYCGGDRLLYKLQPRKFVHYRDTDCDGAGTSNACGDDGDRIGTSFEKADLDTSIPTTPDPAFFTLDPTSPSVDNGTVTVEKAGVYQITVALTPEFQGSRSGYLAVRGEVREATCALPTTLCTACTFGAWPTGNGPDTTPTGTAALYSGANVFKESGQDIGVSASSILLLDRCDRVRMAALSARQDDKKGMFLWTANQSHLFIEYMGGGEND